MSVSPHEILGIKPGASEKEIKAAYKKQAKKFHPDVNGGDKTAEAKFKEVNQAYQELMNPQPEPASGFAGFDPGADGFHPFFNKDIFDAMFRQQHGVNMGMGQSRVVNRIGIDPAMLISGGTFEYTVQELQRINGRIQPVQRAQKIVIEPDTPAMARVAVPNGGSTHFVFLELMPASTERYKVSDLINLTEQQTIDVFTAMTGGEIAVKAPNGKQIKVKFPAGTQSGSIHRMRGLGLRLPDGRRGDYAVEVTVRIPTIVGKDRDEVQQKIIESYMGHTK
jgi:curved DNA-binding protein